MIATGCEDKCVRVFYVAASTDLPLKVFSGKARVSSIKVSVDSMILTLSFIKGHTAKVFHVKWSPLREGVLCSGSDDA